MITDEQAQRNLEQKRDIAAREHPPSTDPSPIGDSVPEMLERIRQRAVARGVDLPAEKAPTAAERRSRLIRAGFPLEAIDWAVTPRRMLDWRAFQVVRDWLRGSQRILVMGGDSQVGKTTAATWAAQWLEDPLYLHATAGLLALDLWRPGLREGLARGGPLVVLDDLGTEPEDRGGHVVARLDWLITGRYDSRRRTIITTNLDTEQFTARYDDRVCERIRRDGRWESFARPKSTPK